MAADLQFSLQEQQVEHELSILVSDLSLLYIKYFNRQMKEMGLTSAQWLVLSCVGRNEGISQTEIADELNKGKSPVGKSLDSLEKSGWIYRKPSTDDRRVRHVFVTDKLHSMDQQLMNVLLEMNQVAESRIDYQAVEDLRHGLSVIRENLRTALSEG